MKAILLFLFAMLGFSTHTQAQSLQLEKAVWAVDYIKAKEGQLPDLVQFFEQNWAGARQYGKKKKYIADYQWFVLPNNADYQVVLMTKYRDQAQYEQREANFQKIFAKHKLVLIAGKSSRDMGEIVKSEEFYEPK